jgi:hypothetical protein
MAIILLPVSNLTTPFDPACPETYVCEIVAENAVLRAL